MFLGFEITAIPVLEYLTDALKVLPKLSQVKKVKNGQNGANGKTHLLCESIKLNNARSPQQDLDFKTLRCPTPCRGTYIRKVQRKGISSIRRLPAKPVLGEPAFPWLLGEIKVDVVEALPTTQTPTLISFFPQPLSGFLNPQETHIAMAFVCDVWG